MICIGIITSDLFKKMTLTLAFIQIHMSSYYFLLSLRRRLYYQFQTKALHLENYICILIFIDDIMT